MHSHSIDGFRHSHAFLGQDHERNERKTWSVIAICIMMMVAEIIAGIWFGSVALIADGLHMSTHAGALLMAALAYAYARRYVSDERFTFGTGKLGDLAAFSSAIVLAMIALLVGYESIGRLLHPVPIAFNQAIAIAALGLAVNLLSAFLLHDGHEHGLARRHHHIRADDEDTALNRDHNLRAAFVHVVADAAVSVFVIAGLLAGRQFGWVWMDPVMGLAATVVILNWSLSLGRSAGAVLLDAASDPSLSRRIAGQLEQNGDRVADLHLWRMGPGHLAAIVSLVSDHPNAPSFYKKQLSVFAGLSHVTVEVEPCPGAHGVANRC